MALLAVAPAGILYLFGKTHSNFIKLTVPNANNNSVKSFWIYLSLPYFFTFHLLQIHFMVSCVSD